MNVSPAKKKNQVESKQYSPTLPRLGRSKQLLPLNILLEGDLSAFSTFASQLGLQEHQKGPSPSVILWLSLIPFMSPALCSDYKCLKAEYFFQPKTNYLSVSNKL